MSKVDWARRPAALIQSDDWNMCAWAPDRATYEATRDLPFMQTRWSAGTLETAEETETLLQVLRRHHGADGRPVVFEPYYLVGNPDYEAIAAKGFAEYIDVGIDEGVSPGWERGAFLETARQGLAEGIWQPEYHQRTHHFSGAAWIRRLHAGEPLAHQMFQRRMYVAEAVKDRTRENDQPGPEPFSWIRGGVEHFRKAFGYIPNAIRNTEQDDEPVAATGIRTAYKRGSATGERSPVADLFYLGSYCNFEPFLTADQEDVVSRCLEDMLGQPRSGLPATVQTHRRNYVSFAGDVPCNLELFDTLLDRLRRERPELVYLTSDEVRQLWETGASLRHFGSTAVIRNWTEEKNQPVPVKIPDGYRLGAIEMLGPDAGGGIELTDDGTRLLVFPGNYQAALERVVD